MKHEDIDHTGLTGVGGSGLGTDTFWDAAGDLAVGSGANTAAKLSLGATNGMALRRVSGAVAWDLPPGHEFSYVEFTSTASITATSEATANTAVTAAAVTLDGSTAIIVEFFVPYARPDASASKELRCVLYDGSSSIGIISYQFNDGAATSYMPIMARRRLTPSAASHTYSIRAFVNAGTGVLAAEAGGSGNRVPGYIRVIKA